MWYIGRILKGIYVNRPLYLYWNGTKDFSKFKGYQPSLIIVSNLLSSKNSEIISLTFQGCSQHSRNDHKLGGNQDKAPDTSGLSLSCHTSIQVNSDCIVPVDHLHLEPREGGQQRGGGVGGREAEWGLIGVRVHHSLRVDPEPRPAHISLVLCENHLGQCGESGCNIRLSSKTFWITPWSSPGAYADVTVFPFQKKKLLIRSAHMVVGT